MCVWSLFLVGAVAVAVVVFFFQAEDGIRDVAVTGVQTCALPISDWMSGMFRFWRCWRGGSRACPWNRHRQGSTLITRGYRSEERRVGKECRSRWSPYH